MFGVNLSLWVIVRLTPLGSFANQVSKKNPNVNFVRRREQDKQKSTKSVDANSRRTMIHRLSNGNIPAYACGPLKRERYINPKMEIELKNFKKEVEKRFKKSTINAYKFPVKEGMRLQEHRGGYVLPLIHQDLTNDGEKEETQMVKNILGSLSSSHHNFEGKVDVKY